MSTSEQHVLPQSRQPMPGSPEPKPPGPVLRSPAQIERDIDARRQRLASTVDALADRLSPKNVARRKLDEIKSRAQALKATVTERITDEQGNPRPDVIGAAAGAAGLILLLVVLQRRRNSS